VDLVVVVVVSMSLMVVLYFWKRKVTNFEKP